MMAGEFALWLVQAGMLYGLARYSWVGARNELQRLGNPIMWFTLFYTLWFMLPQLLAIGPDHPLIGLEAMSSHDRAEVVFGAQVWCIVFLACVAIGYFAITQGMVSTQPPTSAVPPMEKPVWAYAVVLYLIGIFAFHMMAEVYTALGPGVKRSAIVKTAAGKGYAILSFLGSWATAYLVARLWLSGRRFASAGVFIIYAVFVFFTDARGRIMFPAVQATAFIWLYQGRVNLARVVIYAVLGLITLSILDPLSASLKSGDMRRFYEALDPQNMLMTLFFTRNFDGFSNIALITYLDRIPEDLTVLFRGARDAYMNTYFPDVYALGVAFPPTFPGEAWIAGKAPFLVAFGMTYGVILGVMNAFIRFARRESMIWVYLVSLPYLTGVGHDFIPSMGKLTAAVFPAAAWMIYTTMLKPSPAEDRKSTANAPGI